MQKEDVKKSQNLGKSQDKRVQYLARFVKENFGDRHKITVNEKFTKLWTFRNNGETAWPEDTVFIQTNGDELGAVSLPVPGPVNPGQEVDIQMEMTAPNLPGKYCAFFRFVHGDNLRFG